MELNIIEQTFKCEYCNYATIRKGDLKRHLSNKHNIGVKWVYCEEKDCKSKFKRQSSLKQHLSDIHNIGVTWYYCEEKGCDSKFKRQSNLTRHLSDIHNIGVKWFYCEEKGCDSKFKQQSNLTRHLSDIHNIGVKWFYCEEKGCKYKCKQQSSLTQHKKICTGDRHIPSGEFKVLQALSDFGFVEGKDFYHDSTYDKLTNFCGKNLRFDFRFINHKIMIEYDGIQHFEPATFGGISQDKAEQNFIEQQQKDKMKDDFCKKYDYKLIRILYKDFTNILEILSKELNDIIDWTG